MSEFSQMHKLIAALVLLGAFTWLYARGGRSHRAIRWLLGGLLFPLGCNGLAAWSGHWSPWMLLGLVVYPSALSFGYGGKTLWEKIRRRALYGLLLGLASLPLTFPIGQVEVTAAQIFFAIVASVYFGTRNPFGTAVGEEATIALMSTGLIPMLLLK